MNLLTASARHLLDIPLQKVVVGSPVSITPTITGAWESGVVVSCSDTANWNAGTRTWSLTPTFADGGTVKTITFTATDATLSRSATVDVYVFRDFAGLVRPSTVAIGRDAGPYNVASSDTPYLRPCQKIGNTWYTITQGDLGGETWTVFNLYTSTDLVTWTPYDLNPVISAGAAGQYDDAYIVHPSIVQIGGLFYLYYSTETVSSRVCLATSPDLIHWTKRGVVWLGNPNGTGMAYSPSVAQVGSQLRMYYWPRDTSIGRVANQEYAVSDANDGLNWTYGGVSLYANDPTDWDYGDVCPWGGFDPFIVRNDAGFYEQLYTNYSTEAHGQVFGYAISKDGGKFHKAPTGPAMSPSHVPGTFDSFSIGDGSLYFYNGTVYVPYAGLDDSSSTTGGIGVLQP